MSRKMRKIVEDLRESKGTDLELVDKNITNFTDVPGILSLVNLTRITMTHNKLTALPPAIADLVNLQSLNFFNNQIEEIPVSISTLKELRVLNLGMNRLSALPRGFGAFPKLEVLDLTYNNLTDAALPPNMFGMGTLRAMYLGDNDLETIPAEVNQLKNLQILVLRDNDLVSLPKELGDLGRLKELHIQGNRLTVLPPELGNLDLVGTKQVFKADKNPWVVPIADQFQIGVSHVFEYIRSETYKFLYGRHITAGAVIPPKNPEHDKKICRKRPQ